MSGVELIMGMEEVVQHIRELEKREENLKEALAQKFYDHYDQMNYNKLNIARTVGPDLGRMLDHLMAENKRLTEELEKAWDQRGDKWRKARNKTLEAENKKLKEEVESLEKTLEQAKEVAYQCGVEIFSDSDDPDEI